MQHVVWITPVALVVFGPSNRPAVDPLFCIPGVPHTKKSKFHRVSALEFLIVSFSYQLLIPFFNSAVFLFLLLFFPYALDSLNSVG
jgi:hypothetical protein